MNQSNGSPCAITFNKILDSISVDVILSFSSGLMIQIWIPMHFKKQERVASVSFCVFVLLICVRHFDQ